MRSPSETEKRMLAELARHPAWKTLWQLLEEDFERRVALLGLRAVREGEVPDAEARELRGYHLALNAIKRLPDNAFRDVYEGEVITHE